jgi:hypothetical protein
MARFVSGRAEDIVSFSGKFSSESQISLKNRSYAVGSSNRAFHPVHGRIACGSMVLLFLFHEIVALRATIS